ncbi:NADPH-dependent conjugated polyketone reductase C1 [Psilocybe cubensis]|uniref:NADPH-dependent conjugated polyketone reductase C1 n=1 Tax=Psilocybe cubensis TaxID=181762 RepID=A0ACB8GKJ3_PSICU|nr:NADPH-dependent conjugated polyketone reductase C1 [Psilocybe cubensis]KAH9476053.1 NADPH-dependent conjugated polyketone reductase C1 [Psilocybe cubensis]
MYMRSNAPHLTYAKKKTLPLKKNPEGPLKKPLSEISDRLGVSMDQVLLAWIKARGYVPVTMSTKEDRLRGYVKAGDIDLTEADIRAIDEAGAAGP